MAKSAAANKPMSKSEVAATIAERVGGGLTKRQVTQILQAQAELAHEQARNQFTIPGIGKLVLVDRPARMGRNPRTGEPIEIKAKKVLKFRIAKAAKDAILGGGGGK